MRTSNNTVATCLSFDEMTMYLERRLPEGEESRIDDHLKHCDLCAGALESLEQNLLEAEINAEIAKHLEADLKEEVARLAPERQHTKVVPMRASRQWMRYAAALAVLMIPAYMLINSLNSSSPAELYAEHFRPYEDLISTRSAAVDDVDETLVKAMALYNEGAYSDAAPLLSNALSVDPGNHLLKLYSGIAYLGNDQFDEARFQFEELLDQPTMFRAHAEWYLALTYVKNAQLEEAAGLLGNIAMEEGAYQAQATELLEAL